MSVNTLLAIEDFFKKKNIIHLLKGDASTFQTVLFYIAANCLFLGCMSVWFLRKKSWLNRFLLIFIVPCCLIYTGIILYILSTDPMLLLNMTFSGVQEQYMSNWIVVSSICHYAVTDIVVSRVVLYFMQFNNRLPYIPINIQMKEFGFWKYIPLYIILFLWPPIGVLIFLMIYYTKKHCCSV